MPIIVPTADFDAWENGAVKPLALKTGEAVEVSDDLAEILVRDKLAALEPAQPGLPLVGEKPPVDLDALTKEKLVAYAKAEFDLDLDEKLKKDELIAAIQAAAAAKKA